MTQGSRRGGGGWPVGWAALALVATVAACTNPKRLDGEACMRNEDCESEYCRSGTCSARTRFGGQAGAAGAAGSAGGVPEGAAGGEGGPEGGSGGSDAPSEAAADVAPGG